LLRDSVYQILLSAGLGERDVALLIKTSNDMLESINGMRPDSMALVLQVAIEI
jgi:hypothetical protein